MTMNAYQGAWLVYLNGIEIPCPSVSISYGVWRIPEATLAFAPHRLLQRLGNEDRIEVVVFYLDTLADPDDPTWRLAFEGDIIGWSFTNTPYGRQMTFNAVADIAIWTQLHYFFMNNVDAGTGAVLANVAADGYPQTGVFYPFSLFKKGLIIPATEHPENTPADVDRPYEIMYNIVRGMIDANIPAQQQTYPSVNFFARWARKRNFVNRFAALPVFEDGANPAVFPILEAAQATNVLDATKDNLQATIGDAGTLFQVLQEVLSHFYFELAMVPTAPCFRVSLAEGSILGSADVPPSTPSKAAQEPLRLINYFAKPQMLFGIPPTCNVIFPSMISSLSYSESYIAQPTRTYINDQFISSRLQNRFVVPALSAAWPPEASIIMQQRNTGNDPTSNGKNVLLYPEELFKGPVVGRTPAPAWLTYLLTRVKAGKAEDSTAPAEQEANEEETRRMQALFNLYAQYEHYRTRYEKRGGAVNLAFNPYILPGFPCMIFDQRASSFDTVGYVTQVTQQFTIGGMNTAIQYSFGRTFQEMLDALKYDLERTGEELGAAPAEPVPQVRAVVQTFDKAEEFYGALLFGRRTPSATRHAAFDFREAVGYVKHDPTRWYDDETIEPIRLDNLDGSRDVEALPVAKELFTDYAAAMQYVARPICSLQEYLAFVHGGKPLGQLEAEGQVEGASNDYAYTSTAQEVCGATYYTRIKRLRPGPGARPAAAQLGAESDAENVAVPYTEAPEGLSRDYAQTRIDWDAILLAYREAILSRNTPQR